MNSTIQSMNERLDFLNQEKDQLHAQLREKTQEIDRFQVQSVSAFQELIELRRKEEELIQALTRLEGELSTARSSLEIQRTNIEQLNNDFENETALQQKLTQDKRWLEQQLTTLKGNQEELEKLNAEVEQLLKHQEAFKSESAHLRAELETGQNDLREQRLLAEKYEGMLVGVMSSTGLFNDSELEAVGQSPSCSGLEASVDRVLKILFEHPEIASLIVEKSSSSQQTAPLSETEPPAETAHHLPSGLTPYSPHFSVSPVEEIECGRSLTDSPERADSLPNDTDSDYHPDTEQEEDDLFDDEEMAVLSGSDDEEMDVPGEMRSAPSTSTGAEGSTSLQSSACPVSVDGAPSILTPMLLTKGQFASHGLIPDESLDSQEQTLKEEIKKHFETHRHQPKWQRLVDQLNSGQVLFPCWPELSCPQRWTAPMARYAAYKLNVPIKQKLQLEDIRKTLNPGSWAYFAALGQFVKAKNDTSLSNLASSLNRSNTPLPMNGFFINTSGHWDSHNVAFMRWYFSDESLLGIRTLRGILCSLPPSSLVYRELVIEYLLKRLSIDLSKSLDTTPGGQLNKDIVEAAKSMKGKKGAPALALPQQILYPNGEVLKEGISNVSGTWNMQTIIEILLEAKRDGSRGHKFKNTLYDLADAVFRENFADYQVHLRRTAIQLANSDRRKMTKTISFVANQAHLRSVLYPIEGVIFSDILSFPRLLLSFIYFLGFEHVDAEILKDNMKSILQLLEPGTDNKKLLDVKDKLLTLMLSRRDNSKVLEILKQVAFFQAEATDWSLQSIKAMRQSLPEVTCAKGEVFKPYYVPKSRAASSCQHTGMPLARKRRAGEPGTASKRSSRGTK